MSKSWWQGMLPPIPTGDESKKPTSGQFNNWTTTLTIMSRRMNDRLLEDSSHDSVPMKKGQSELMGSIHCTQIPFILVATNQSHLSPLSKTLLSQPTSRSIDPHRYWYCWIVLCHDSHNPLCLHIYVLCLALFFVTITSYRTFISQAWRFCLPSAPLWFCWLHIPYCYLFLANWSMRNPALNL